MHYTLLSVDSIFSKFTSSFAPPPYFVNYLVVITVAPQVKGTKTECNFTQICNNTWEFSNYDLNGTYENNAHCVDAVQNLSY